MSSGEIQSAERPAKVRLSPLWEVEALLSGRLYDLKHRLSLTFKINSMAAITETGIAGDVIVDAVITTLSGICQPVRYESILQHIDL